jgi:hypothetical protein
MTDDILDLDPERPHRLEAEVLGPLTLEDAAHARDYKGIKAPAVLRFRDAHHRLARYLALGLRDYEVSAVTGYSLSRISILKSDPAFENLISIYRQSPIGDHGEVRDLMEERKIKSERVQVHFLDQVLDKADNNGPVEVAEVRIAMDMNSDANDRIGHSKRSAQLNVNLDLASRISAGRSRAKLIEGEAE